MQVPKIVAAGDRDDLLAKVTLAQSDALALYDYLSRRSGAMAFDAVITLPAGKIAKDPGLTARLFDLLAELSRAAAPVTPAQTRVWAALQGHETTPEIAALARHLRRLRRGLTYLAVTTAIVAVILSIYAEYGQAILTKSQGV